MRCSHQSGFSLVELSIVLVILGLLTGGILGGQALMRAAELRSVVTDHQKLTTAVQTFKDKYFALPGDMPNAESFWGSAAVADGACRVFESSGSETCNGDGDGMISPSLRSNEWFRFWQHLANASLVEGTFTGAEGPDGVNDSLPGINAPNTKLGSAATWHVIVGTVNTSTVVFENDYKKPLMIGARVNGTSWPSGAIFTTEEAWNIDVKTDDGVATQGNVWAVNYGSCTGATNDTDYRNYNLSATGKRCALIFHNAF